MSFCNVRALSASRVLHRPLNHPIPTNSSRAVVSHADSAPAFWQIGNLWRAMATGVQTSNSFTLLDQIVHSGGGGGPCTHTREFGWLPNRDPKHTSKMLIYILV
jgi:hypothetical protein